MRKIIVYLFFALLGVSTVVNYLYLFGIVDRRWFLIGFIVVTLCSAGINIFSLINKAQRKLLEVVHFHKAILGSVICMFFVWVITLTAAMLLET